MKATAMAPFTMKGHVDNTITPYSISGNCSNPAPLVYRNNMNNIKAKIKRMKLTGCIDIGHRKIYAMPLPELANTNRIKLRFGGVDN